MKRIKEKNFRLMKRLQELLKPERIKLEELLKNKSKFDFPAVYVFSKPNSKRVIYAGRTKTIPFWKRMKHHKSINKGSDLNIMIKGKVGYPQKVGEYGVRYLKMKDSRERMFFENFIIGILQPELNKHG